MLREEFDRLWTKQASLDSPLAKLITPELRKQLDNPEGNDVWRHQGLLFGQRRTYWNTGTLGRRDLEPTDRCVPLPTATLPISACLRRPIISGFAGRVRIFVRSRRRSGPR